MVRWFVLPLILLTTLPAAADESPFLERARALKASHGAYLSRVARETIEMVVDEGNLEPQPSSLSKTTTPAPFGIFVTIVVGSKTRGCFGTMESRGKTLEELIVDAAIGAARFDPRVTPLRQDELARALIIVSIVGPSVPVLAMSEVDSKRNGLLVRAPGDRNSVLLPGEARTTGWQLKRSLRQAGIRRGEPYEMFRFRTVTIYERRGL
ncbi:MAG: AMMECR1 domain-containing protein [Myxococcota bacterium]|jgi:AMMECR1 domain-containing protein